MGWRESAEAFRNVSRSGRGRVGGLFAIVAIARKRRALDDLLNESLEIIRTLPGNQFGEIFGGRHGGHTSKPNAAPKVRRTFEPNELLELFEPLEPLNRQPQLQPATTVVDIADSD